MSISSANAGTTRPKIVIERIYRARVEELWALWTTKEGFESWWGPQGFRVEVHALEARTGGRLDYDMIADAPEAIEAMRRSGHAVTHGTRGTFTEFQLNRRLEITHVIDFLPGIEPYESTMVVEFQELGESTRMVVTLYPLHDKATTRMSAAGFTSQLGKLDRRFAAG
jgi:uncharacterized protein YndB with AHSA1/START domain